ncbi:MAG TPA: DUF4440 domain-containing protein [Bacteroidota bacterium]|nr:DUF4440 domain-containing protein [Bacteroidota bacterium]
MRKTMIPAVVSLLLVSCGQQQPDMEAMRKMVDEYNAASIEAMTSGNMDKVMSYYADDAISMPPNGPMLKGKEAIQKHNAEMMKSGMKLSNVKFTTVEVDAGGKVSYEVGSYEMDISIPILGSMKDKGKYVAIWKQQADDSWKVHAEMWNTDTPLPSVDKPSAKKTDSKKAVKKSTKPAKKTSTPVKKKK